MLPAASNNDLSLRVMSDIRSADPENHVFRDVGCVVSHALQVARHNQGVQGVTVRFNTRESWQNQRLRKSRG